MCYLVEHQVFNEMLTKYSLTNTLKLAMQCAVV